MGTDIFEMICHWKVSSCSTTSRKSNERAVGLALGLGLVDRHKKDSHILIT